MTERVSPELEAQMIALVDRMTAPKWDASNVDWVAPLLAEARKIKAKLPVVDPDLIEAREIAAHSCYRPGTDMFDRMIAGLDDSSLNVRGCLAAIKRGRELAAA